MYVRSSNIHGGNTYAKSDEQATTQGPSFGVSSTKHAQLVAESVYGFLQWG